MGSHERDLINFFQRALEPLKQRVYMLAGRAILTAINDGAKIQEVQLKALKDETLEKVQRFQEFGFTSNPPKGTEAILVALGGSRGNSVIIATDNRLVRLTGLASGETAIYTDDGTYLHLKKAGIVELKAATHLIVDVPDSTFKGNVKVEGNTEMVGTLLVKENVTAEKDVLVQQDLAVTLNGTVGGNLGVTGVVSAAGYTGPMGGAAVLTVDIQTTGDITANNVIAGGTDMADIKATFNGHTHPENGTGGGTTSAPNETL